MTETVDPRAVAYTEVDYSRRFLKPGQPESVLHDVYLILRHDDAWKGVIAEDEFAQRILKLKNPPYEPEGAPLGEWSEVDDARTAIWLAEKKGMKKIGITTVQEAVMTVGNDNKFHPLRNYLESLVWDGEPRVDCMLGEYLSAPFDDEADLMRYTMLISRIWMLSGVARIFKPGCKADYVLILEGDQRIGKSTFLNILAGSYFSDTNFDLRNKDAFQHLTGKWIIELQELDSFNKADTTLLKAFFSSRIDNYRPPYGRRNRDFPRQCIFAGTTNQNEYLRDNTGNLRFMGIHVRKLDAKRLEADRDQLWAEAVHRYKAGEIWYPTWEELTLMAKYQELREIPDPQEERIEMWLSDQPDEWDTVNPPVTVGRILKEVLDVPLGAENVKYKGSLIGRMLRKLGWEKKQFGRDIDRKEYGRSYYQRRRVYPNDTAGPKT